MHSILYKLLISKLPDQFVEKWGGSYYKFISYFAYTPRIDLPVDIAGIKFPNPVGMPAGWIDTPDKLHTIRRLGVGIPTIKTITVGPKKGNPYPRLVRKGEDMINSLGLPNKGVDWWVENYQKPEYPTILSIKGNSIMEWTELISKLEKKAEILELNLSCPNVGNGVMDIETSAKLVDDISSITKTKIFLKLSPEFKPIENRKLIEKTRPSISGITMINTKPVQHEKLGNPAKQGGLSGRSIYPMLIENLDEIRSVFGTMSDLPILATGGVYDSSQAIEIMRDYKAIPMGLTAFLTKGARYYYKLAKSIKNEFVNSSNLQSHLG